MTLVQTTLEGFDYMQIDGQTAEFLRMKEARIHDIVGKAYTDLGRELKEAQEALAGSRYDGVFVKWFTSLGWKKDKVYDLIHRYNLVFGISESGGNIRLIEDLPVSLSYEIAKPSANATAKQAVLDGEVKTLKEYRELKERMEKAEEAAETERRARQQAESQSDLLRQTLESVREQPPEIEVKTEYIRDDRASERLQRYEARFGDIESYESQTYRIPNATDISASIQTFSYEVRGLLKKYAYLTQYQRELTTLPDVVREDYEGTLDALGRFATDLNDVFHSAKSGSRIINVN